MQQKIVLQDGKVSLYHGDCLAVMDILIENGVKVDCIITDPPYGRTKNKWDTIIPFDEMWSRLNKIIKPNGAIVLFGQALFTSKLSLSNEKDYRYNLVWDKRLPSGHLNANRMPLSVHEDIIVFYKKMVKYNPQKYLGEKPSNSKGNMQNPATNNNYGHFNLVDNRELHGNMKFPRSIVSYETVLQYRKPHPSISIHPTQKPVELLEYLAKTYTDENEIILDFTAGSFSMAEACINIDRQFIGIELEKKNYDLGLKRVLETLSKRG